GMLPAIDPPQPPETVLLAGRRWRVVEVDATREEILVEPTTGKKAPLFHGSGGEIHSRLRQNMRYVLLGNHTIRYLNKQAAAWLEQARASATEAGLQYSPWQSPSSDRSLLFTWSGTRTQRTLALLGQAAGLKCIDHGLAIEFEAPTDDVRNKLVGV